MSKFAAFILVSMLFNFNLRASAATQGSVSLEKRIVLEGAYANLFTSINDFFNQQEKLGVISLSDRIAIEKLIANYGVDLSSKLPKPVVKRTTISWGDYSVEVLKSNDLKLQNGRILHRSISIQYADVFKNVLAALSAKQVAAHPFLNLYLPQAQAASIKQALNAVGAAIGTTAGLADGVVNFAMAFTCGGIATPFDWAKYEARALAFDGAIDCKRDRDFSIMEYPSFMSTMVADETANDRMLDFKSTDGIGSLEAKGGASAFKSLCLDPVGDFLFGLGSSRSTDNPKSKIKKSVPESVLVAAGMSSPFSCNEDNKTALKNYFRKFDSKLTSAIREVNIAKKDAAVQSTSPEASK